MLPRPSVAVTVTVHVPAPSSGPSVASHVPGSAEVSAVLPVALGPVHVITADDTEDSSITAARTTAVRSAWSDGHVVASARPAGSTPSCTTGDRSTHQRTVIGTEWPAPRIATVAAYSPSMRPARLIEITTSAVVAGPSDPPGVAVTRPLSLEVAQSSC